MRQTPRGIVMVTMAAALALSAAAHAQEVSPACKPVFDAVFKMTTTPHHAVTTTNDRTAETISTADATYVLNRGVWHKSPISPKDVLAQVQEGMKDLSSASCKALAEEAVDGKAAIVYQTHYEQKDMGATDSKIWLAKATGLPLRTDVSLQAGEKVSIVTKFDYDHITAPIVK